MNGRSIVAVSATAALLLASCGGGSPAPTSPTPSTSQPPTVSAQPPPAPPPTDTTPPVLTGSFIPLEDATTFLVFGRELGPGRENPAYEVVTSNPAAQIRAVTAGVVTAIEITGAGDRYIITKPSAGSIYDVIYDHVNNVAVTVGQQIAAGDVIGTAGTVSGGRGRTELQINRNQPAPTVSVCPRALGSAEFNAAFAALSQRLNNSDNTCLRETVIP